MTSQCPPVDRLFIVPRRETLANIIASINENIPLNSPSTPTRGQDFANNINNNLKTGLMKPKEMIGVGGKQLFQSYKSGKGKVEKLIENCNNSDGQGEGDIFSQYILGMENNSAEIDKVYYLKFTVLEATDLPGKNVKEVNPYVILWRTSLPNSLSRSSMKMATFSPPFEETFVFLTDAKDYKSLCSDSITIQISSSLTRLALKKNSIGGPINVPLKDFLLKEEEEGVFPPWECSYDIPNTDKGKIKIKFECTLIPRVEAKKPILKAKPDGKYYLSITKSDKAEAQKDKELLSILRGAIEDVENEKKLQRAFRKLDQDSSGGLSKEEFVVIAREILPNVIIHDTSTSESIGSTDCSPVVTKLKKGSDSSRSTSSLSTSTSSLSSKADDESILGSRKQWDDFKSHPQEPTYAMLDISESQQKKFGLSFGPVSNSFNSVTSTVSNSVGNMNSALLSPRGGKDKDKEKDGKDCIHSLKDDIEISGISSDLDQRQRYEKIFEAADVDRNGAISYEEFKAFIIKVTTK